MCLDADKQAKARIVRGPLLFAPLFCQTARPAPEITPWKVYNSKEEEIP